MTKTLYLLTILSLLLAACGTLEITIDKDGIPNASAAGSIPTAVPTLDPLTLLLSMASGSETIRMKMLFSHTLWQSLWLDGTVTWYPPEGTGSPAQVLREQVWFYLPDNKFRWFTGTVEGVVETAWISDGETIMQIDGF